MSAKHSPGDYILLRDRLAEEVWDELYPSLPPAKASPHQMQTFWQRLNERCLTLLKQSD